MINVIFNTNCINWRNLLIKVFIIHMQITCCTLLPVSVITFINTYSSVETHNRYRWFMRFVIPGCLAVQHVCQMSKTARPTYYCVAFTPNCVANCSATPDKLFPAYINKCDLANSI